MKVICIETYDFNDLTKGKIYDVIKKGPGLKHEFMKYVDINSPYNHEVYIFYTIIDDSGWAEDYKKSQFISLEEWREKQLNELGI